MTIKQKQVQTDLHLVTSTKLCWSWGYSSERA